MMKVAPTVQSLGYSNFIWMGEGEKKYGGTRRIEERSNTRLLLIIRGLLAPVDEMIFFQS